MRFSTGCGDAQPGRYSEVIAAKTAAMEPRPPTRVPKIEVFERPTVTDAGCRIPPISRLARKPLMTGQGR